MSKIISELLNTYLALILGMYNEKKKRKNIERENYSPAESKVSLAFAFNP